jgi:hypothetical protein
MPPIFERLFYGSSWSNEEEDEDPAFLLPISGSLPFSKFLEHTWTQS